MHPPFRDPIWRGALAGAGPGTWDSACLYLKRIQYVGDRAVADFSIEPYSAVFEDMCTAINKQVNFRLLRTLHEYPHP